MSREYGSRPSDSNVLPDPEVTLGLLMVGAILLPATAAWVLGPATGGQLLVAMTPLLLLAALRTSITTYSVFERGPFR